jgi:hypothetical protein
MERQAYQRQDGILDLVLIDLHARNAMPLWSPMSTLFAAAPGGGLPAAFALADRSTSAADAIGKTADNIGLGVEAWQELRFAPRRELAGALFDEQQAPQARQRLMDEGAQ